MSGGLLSGIHHGSKQTADKVAEILLDAWEFPPLLYVIHTNISKEHKCVPMFDFAVMMTVMTYRIHIILCIGLSKKSYFVDFPYFSTEVMIFIIGVAVLQRFAWLVADAM